MLDNNLIKVFEKQQTPFYYYDVDLLERTLDAVNHEAGKYGFHVHYALKANFNDRLLKLVQAKNLGADCVSGNEVLKALETGFDASKIVFAGVGKSDSEIDIALENEIFSFNVESIQELEVINQLASEKKKIARVALRINPNVDAQTHHYITTGLDENKFGIKVWELEDCITTLKELSSVKLIGIHFHVGSQITDLKVFRSLCVKVNELNNWFEERGHYLDVLNVGGGLGIDYHDPDKNSIPNFAAYFETFDQFLERKPNQEVHFELGRAIVAQCGSLISKVLYVKKGIKKNFIILDAGMTELMRPALYQAYHKVQQLSGNGNRERINYDVVGPICESSDCFAKEVPLFETKRGDLIAIRSAGAYGEVMSSRYNLRDEIRYVFSNDN
ncbi:diaminopimelate decarboxylase [Albibacterium indicum]|uniref:diaminopimelate decarboxylase n=1 Tax=Albibacterium indicum TaxID=2292082 RepID=UPI000E4CD0C6|nr:diaminopimelate decarboxylase [Pedobacter indicus]